MKVLSLQVNTKIVTDIEMWNIFVKGITVNIIAKWKEKIA